MMITEHSEQATLGSRACETVVAEPLSMKFHDTPLHVKRI